jgi:menaquinone-dependent protoporphyrinogen IX oxidase
MLIFYLVLIFEKLVLGAKVKKHAFNSALKKLKKPYLKRLQTSFKQGMGITL